jgi:predicted nucleotidyltransferase
MEKKIMEVLKNNKEFLKKNFRVTRIGIFGSFARNEETENSDIDILVEFEKTPDMVTFFSVEEFLEKKLNKKIDMVRPQGLKKHIKENVLSEVIYI